MVNDLTHMLTQPVISVLMCAYNSEKHIGDAVRSILNQSLPDFELVIVNDGSSDSTLAVISEFKDPRIIIQNIPHSGLAKALNSGLKITRGELVARMDTDDIALPGRLQKQFEFIQKNPDICVVGTGYKIVLPNGSQKSATVPLVESDSAIKKVLPRFNPFMHGSVMIRKLALIECNYYDENFLMAQDYDLWFRLAKKYKFANLNEALMLRREGRQTLAKERRQNWYAIKARFRAICEGNSHAVNLVFLFRPFIIMVTPIWLKQFVRLIIRKRYG